jgi:hypothetical protein
MRHHDIEIIYDDTSHEESLRATLSSLLKRLETMTPDTLISMRTWQKMSHVSHLLGRAIEQNGQVPQRDIV